MEMNKALDQRRIPFTDFYWYC